MRTFLAHYTRISAQVQKMAYELHILILRSIVESSVAPLILGIDLFGREFSIECLEGGIGVLRCGKEHLIDVDDVFSFCVIA